MILRQGSGQAAQSRSVRRSLRQLGLAAALAATCATPARADHDTGPALAEELFNGLVQERDVSLVFSFLREAWRASLQGREARPPYELEQRGNALAEELKRRGATIGERMIDAIEKSVREELRRKPLPPPSGAYQRM